MIAALAVVSVAISFGAIVKVTTGMGLPPVALPVVAAFVGIEDAVVIMAYPMFVTNLALVIDHWEVRRVNPVLPRMLWWVVGGSLVGAWLLTRLDERMVAVGIASLVAAFLVSRAVKPHARLSDRSAIAASAPVAFAGGISQGATGLSGPIFATFLQLLGLSPVVFVFSISVLFQFSATAQLVGFIALGKMTWQLCALGVLASILALSVMWAFRPVATKLSSKHFDLVIVLVLVGSSLKMLYDAFT